MAKDEEGRQSDIDLLAVGAIDERSFHKTISNIEKEIGREINYTLMTRQEFDERIKKSEPFLKRILEEQKILIKGTLNVD